jgi:hypothetical protein
MNPHAHIRSLPPEGAHASLAAPQEYFFRAASPAPQGAALREA